MNKEERDVLRGNDEEKWTNVALEKFGAVVSSEKTICILGDRWWAQAAKP